MFVPVFSCTAWNAILNMCPLFSCTAWNSSSVFVPLWVVQPQKVYYVCSCVQLYSLKTSIMFVPVFSCTAWKGMSSVSSCVSVVQPEKIYQEFVHDSVVLLEKFVKCLFLCSVVQPEKIYCHTDPCPVRGKSTRCQWGRGTVIIRGEHS